MMTNTQLSTPIDSRPVRRMTQLARAALNPPFLRRIDNHLLVRRPWLWSLRVHRAAYLGVIIAIFAFLLGLLIPAQQPASIQRYLFISAILIVVLQTGAMILWLFGQNRFNVTQEYGVQYDKKGWREFFGYAAGFLLILSSLPLFMTTARSQLRNMNRPQVAREMLLLRITQYALHQSYNEATGDESLFGRVRHRLDNDYTSLDWGLYFSPNYGYYGSFNYHQDQATPERQFINQWVSSADLDPYRQAFASGENPILPIIAKYAGRDLATVQRASDTFNRYSNSYIDYYESLDYIFQQAYDNGNFIFQAEFEGAQQATFAFWLFVLAIASHFALLRILIKYNQKRTLALTVGWIGFLGIAFFIAGAMNYNVSRLFYYSWELIDYQVFAQRYFTTLVAVFVVILTITFVSLKSLGSLERFSRMRALQLGSLPFLLAALPYALLVLLMVNTFSYPYGDFFSAHFMTDLTARSLPHEVSWSLYPLGYWLLYAGQFAYVPLLPFMKKRLVRLQSLPQG